MVTNGLLLAMAFYSIYHVVQVFYLKRDIYGFENYDNRYFDIVAVFDVIGVVLLLALTVIRTYITWSDLAHARQATK